MRTNSKQVREAVQQYIVNCIDTSDYIESDKLPDKLKFVCEEFNRVAVYPYNIYKLKNWQTVFIDWYCGLPSYFNISVYSHEIVYNLMPSFGLPIPEGKDETDAINLFNYLIFSNFILLCKKNGIDFYEYCHYSVEYTSQLKK